MIKLNTMTSHLKDIEKSTLELSRDKQIIENTVNNNRRKN